MMMLLQLLIMMMLLQLLFVSCLLVFLVTGLVVVSDYQSEAGMNTLLKRRKKTRRS